MLPKCQQPSTSVNCVESNQIMWNHNLRTNCGCVLLLCVSVCAIVCAWVHLCGTGCCMLSSCQKSSGGLPRLPGPRRWAPGCIMLMYYGDVAAHVGYAKGSRRVHMSWALQHSRSQSGTPPRVHATVCSAVLVLPVSCVALPLTDTRCRAVAVRVSCVPRPVQMAGDLVAVVILLVIAHTQGTAATPDDSSHSVLDTACAMQVDGDDVSFADGSGGGGWGVRGGVRVAMRWAGWFVINLPFNNTLLLLSFAALLVLMAQPTLAVAAVGQIGMGTVYVLGLQVATEMLLVYAHGDAAAGARLMSGSAIAFNLGLFTSALVAYPVYEACSAQVVLFGAAVVIGAVGVLWLGAFGVRFATLRRLGRDTDGSCVPDGAWVCLVVRGCGSVVGREWGRGVAISWSNREVGGERGERERDGTC